MSQSKRGRGIFGELQADPNRRVYKPMTTEDLKSALESFMDDIPTKKEHRTLVFQTGVVGKSLIASAIGREAEKQVSMITVNELYLAGSIELHQKEMLLSGLTGGDEEMYQLCKKLLNGEDVSCQN